MTQQLNPVMKHFFLYCVLILLFFDEIRCPGGSSGGGGRGGSSSSGSSSRSSSSSGSRSSSSSSSKSGGIKTASNPRTVSTASASIYGSGLSKYNGPTGAYPAGTRSVYVPSGPNFLLATTWLLIINDEIDDFDEGSSAHSVPIDPNDPPPGCTLSNSSATPIGNFSDDEVTYWNRSRIYNEGNFSIECQPVDITIGENSDSRGLSAGAIVGIVIGSIVGLVFLACFITLCLVI